MVFVVPAVAGPYDLGHRRGPGRRLRRSGNGRSPRRLRPDPVHIRRREARHPLDRHLDQPHGLHRQPDDLPRTVLDPLVDLRRWQRPGQPGRLVRIEAVESTSGRPNARQAEVQAEVLRPDPRRQEPDQAGRQPEVPAILEARNGDANLRRAAFILPRATILDQSHIKTICTRVQLAANECPKNSIYGNAKATSPLLDEQAQGPGLPDLVQQHPAGPAGQPARPGADPAARRDQLRARPPQDGVQQHPGRGGRPSSSST